MIISVLRESARGNAKGEAYAFIVDGVKETHNHKSLNWSFETNRDIKKDKKTGIPFSTFDVTGVFGIMRWHCTEREFAEFEATGKAPLTVLEFDPLAVYSKRLASDKACYFYASPDGTVIPLTWDETKQVVKLITGETI